MFVEAIGLSLVVAVIRGGKIRRLGELKLQKAWLIFAPGGLIALLYLSHIPGLKPISNYALPVHIVAYCMVFALIWLNRRLAGMLIIGAGALLNFAAMAFNGGQMPVSHEAARYVGMAEQLEKGNAVRHVSDGGNTRLYYLSDIIPAPSPPFLTPGVISVGDILLSVGLFVLIQRVVCSAGRQRATLAPDADSG